MTQNLWDTAKAVLRGKFIAIQSFIKKQETSQIKKTKLIPKAIRERRTKKAKGSRRKEIIKIRSEINERASLNHQRADSKSKKNDNPAACGQKPHSQKDRQDEKAEGYIPDEGTR